MTERKSGAPKRHPTPARAARRKARPQPVKADVRTEDARKFADIIERSFPRAQGGTLRSLIDAPARRFDAGDTVVAQGDDRHTVFVFNGHLGLRRMTVDGRELIPRVVSTGELAALLSIVSRPSAVEAVALSECHVALWSGRQIHALANGDTGFALDLLDHVLLAFEAIVGRLDGLRHQNSVRRVARVLEDHAKLVFGETATVPRTYLPALVGTSREMMGRVLRALESDGVVARDGRSRLKLLDPERLTRLADR